MGVGPQQDVDDFVGVDRREAVRGVRRNYDDVAGPDRFAYAADDLASR